MRAREPGDYRHGPERGGSPPGIPGFVGAADRSAGCGRRDGRRLHGPHGGPPPRLRGKDLAPVSMGGRLRKPVPRPERGGSNGECRRHRDYRRERARADVVRTHRCANRTGRRRHRRRLVRVVRSLPSRACDRPPDSVVARPGAARNLPGKQPVLRLHALRLGPGRRISGGFRGKRGHDLRSGGRATSPPEGLCPRCRGPLATGRLGADGVSPTPQVCGGRRAGCDFPVPRNTLRRIVRDVWDRGPPADRRDVLWPLWILLLGGASLYAGFRVRKVARAGLWSFVPYAILVVIAWDLSRMVGYTAGRIDRLIKGSAHFRF